MKSIALVLGSNLNNSTERSMDDMASFFLSKNIIVELFAPDIPYFHSYLFNLIELLGLNPSKYYTNPIVTRIAYLFIKIYLSIKKNRFNKYLFSHEIYFYKSYKPIELSNFDHVITHCTYLLPFIKSKSPPLVTINADYFHQQKVSPNPNWWVFCVTLLSKYGMTTFANSDELANLYNSMNYRIRGIIPDGPSYKGMNRIVKSDRNFLLVYAHNSKDKGFNCLDAESVFFLENLNKGQISLLGSDLVYKVSNKFKNYGSLPYRSYLLKFKEYKLFLYLSNSDSFESPPIDALLSGCIVISSKTPAAKYYAQYTKRILLIESIKRVEIERALSLASEHYSELTKSEYDHLLECALQHSAIEGAKRYLNFINIDNL